MSYSDLRHSRGFTLIEIVMVLVLIGILAAVAVSKYFDLEKQAREQMAKAVISEAQARMDGLFAQHLLNGGSCKSFLEEPTDVGLAILLGQDGFEKQDAMGTTVLVQGSMSVYFATDKVNPPDITYRVYFNDQYNEDDGYYDGKVYFPCSTAE